MQLLNQNDIIKQSPGYMGWKDKNLAYLGCNENLAALLRLSSTEKILGLTDKDLIDYSDETYQFHYNNDVLALSGKTVQCVHVSHSPYNGDVFNIVKKPLFDHHNQIIGLIYHCSVIPDPFAELLKNNRNEKPTNAHQLSTRERECLLYILRGKSLKEIADILNLSKRTIETYFENIKSKFGCCNKTEL